MSDIIRPICFIASIFPAIVAVVVAPLGATGYGQGGSMAVTLTGVALAYALISMANSKCECERDDE